jgi:hypothetical protein
MMRNKTLTLTFVVILSILLLTTMVTVGGMAAPGPNPEAADGADAGTPVPGKRGDLVEDQISVQYAGPLNRQLLQPESVNASGWVTIMSEGFEGAFPGSWTLYGDDYTWNKKDCRANQGSYSGWGVGGGAQGSGLSCGGSYPNNANAWMIYGPFSLADATDAEMFYSFWTNTEDEFDYLFVGASTDGSNFSGYNWWGDRSWTDDAFDLTDVYQLGDLTGEPEVWIGFLFWSDESVTYPEGAYVDDIELRKYVPPATDWLNLVYEDFEDDFPYYWTVFDDNGPDYGEYQWGKRSCNAFSGSYSGWGVGGGYDGSSLSCGDLFPTNADSWMMYGPFSLEDALEAEFRFMLWLNTDDEPVSDPDDFVFYGASVDGSEFHGFVTWGSSDWSEVVFDLASVDPLGDLRGQPEVWVAIVFESDGNAANDLPYGALVDEVAVRIKKTASTIPDQRLYLPFTIREAAAYFEGPWELEPNDSLSNANGNLRSDQTYYGYHNDVADYYRVYLTNGGQLTIDFDSQLTAKDSQDNYVIQLQLKDQYGSRLEYRVGPDEQISRSVPAGIYYIYVYTRVDYVDASKQYSLWVNYP